MLEMTSSDESGDEADNNSVLSDDGSFSSALSSEGGITSPGSSCPTPNSAGGGDDLVFTLGVTDGTPYQCLYCDKAFQRQNYLKKHQQTHKEHLPFECEFCRQRFKHKRSRDRHVKLHTGEKKYKCEKCGHRYSRSDHLNIHKKTHDLRKPHQCSLCNRGYNTVAALTSHLQKHSKTHATEPGSPPPGAAQFKCLDCETKFGTPEELQNHMKDEHNVQPVSLEPHSAPSPSLMSPLSRSISKLHASAASAYQSSPSPLSFPLQFPLASSPSRYSSSPTSMARYMCNYCPAGSEGFSSLESLHVHIQSVHGSLLNNQDLIRELSHRLSHSLSSPLSLSPSLSLSQATPCSTLSNISSISLPLTGNSMLYPIYSYLHLSPSHR
uniref:Zinc finger protein 423 homolog n=1 Tax=Cacopsylla melanoneura TaxID=428564 RepID=A0A8D8Z5F0_9HEMI